MIEFAIVVASYNNAKWCIKNVQSIGSQHYPHFHLYYIDDASTDGTGELVEQFISSSVIKDKTTIIHNTERKGSLANIYETISQIDPKKVVLCVDGDDWLAHDKVLDLLASVYADPNIWLTYGNFEGYPAGIVDGRCEPIPDEVCEAKAIRKYPFVAHHLKTFYAGLFHRIKKQDLMLDDKFFPVAGDIAFMYPMLEMASKGHFCCLSDVLYIYNVENPLNDFKIHEKSVVEYAWIIRVREPYESLDLLISP